jgi:hypothetical protein
VIILFKNQLDKKNFRVFLSLFWRWPAHHRKQQLTVHKTDDQRQCFNKNGCNLNSAVVVAKREWLLVRAIAGVILVRVNGPFAGKQPVCCC